MGENLGLVRGLILRSQSIQNVSMYFCRPTYRTPSIPFSDRKFCKVKQNEELHFPGKNGSVLSTTSPRNQRLNVPPGERQRPEQITSVHTLYRPGVFNGMKIVWVIINADLERTQW